MSASSMDLTLDNVGKRYRYEWIFRKIDLNLRAGDRFAVTGANGAGKSTLMKILSFHLRPSEGQIQLNNQGNLIDADAAYRYISYAAPYIELIEELTLHEAIRFHQNFKPFLNQLTSNHLLDRLQFAKSNHSKLIRYFSSGMKQRLKLLLAICTDTPLLLLDEPTTNLDRQGMEWYHELVADYGNDRTIIVASNVEEDYRFCDQTLSIMDFK